MSDIRARFHKEMADLEEALLGVADQAELMVGLAVEAVCMPDMDLAAQVVQLDAKIDRTYLDVHNRWMHADGPQQPMASDLRMMSVLAPPQHHSRTNGRSMRQHRQDGPGHLSACPARRRSSPRSGRWVTWFGPMIRTGVEALVRRDLDEARLLPAMDEPIDRLNRNMYKEVVDCGPDPGNARVGDPDDDWSAGPSSASATRWSTSPSKPPFF